MIEVFIYLPVILFFFWALFLVLSIVKGAPYVRTPKKRIALIIEMLELNKNDVAMDLGSGNGDIVIEIARKGVESHGSEINWFLVLISWLKIRVAGVSSLAFVHWGNMWKVGMSKYTVVVVYGFPNIMKDLEKKLLSELPNGARVVSHAFKFPNWKPTIESGSVFLYIKD